MSLQSTSSTSNNTPFLPTSEAPAAIFSTVEDAISAASTIYRKVTAEKTKHDGKLKEKNNSMYLSGMGKKVTSNMPSATQTAGLAGATSFVGYVWKTSNDTQRTILIVFIGIAWLGFVLGVIIRKQTKLRLQSKDKTVDKCVNLAKDQAKVAILKEFLQSAHLMLKAHDISVITNVYNTMYTKCNQAENQHIGLNPEIYIGLGSIWNNINNKNISDPDKVKNVKNVLKEEFIATLHSEVQLLKRHVKDIHTSVVASSSDDTIIPMEDMSGKGKEPEDL